MKVIGPKAINSLGKGSRKFVAAMSTGAALTPVILLEGFVTGGRTIQAHKRGGFIEARERLTEEVLGAIVWLFGVTAFNKLGNYAGKKMLKLPSVNFDTGEDALRKPFANFMGGVVKGKYSKKFLAGFKFGKIILSILAANSVVGFLVPKVNQAITRKYQLSVKKATQKMLLEKNLLNNITFNDFAEKSLNKISTKAVKKQLKSQENFTGKSPVDVLLSLSHKFENNTNYKLISTDCGVASGRAISARNGNERLEVLVRDLGSIYFYLWSKNHINSLYNKIDSGKTYRLDPVSAKQTDVQIQRIFENRKSLSVEQFKKIVFGKENATIPENIRFDSDGIIKLSDFIKMEKNKGFIARAKEMAKLQPEIVGEAILTKDQVMDVYKGGLLNNPKFLNAYYNQLTYDIELKKGKSSNPFSYVSKKDLDFAKKNMLEYVEDFIKETKDGIVTSEKLTKYNHKNFTKNAIGLGLGLGISALFLSTIIPKLQYLITQKRTGKNEFPGIQEDNTKTEKEKK